MYVNNKKILAREFLYFISILTIILFFIIGIFIYNYSIDQKLVELKSLKASEIKKEAILKQSEENKVRNQKEFSEMLINLERKKDNKNGFVVLTQKQVKIVWDLLEIRYKDSVEAERLWRKIRDEIKYKFKLKSKIDLIKFIENNIITDNDLSNYKLGVLSSKNLQEIRNELDILENRRYSPEDIKSSILNVLKILFVLLFIFRYLFYGIKWSIKTLKE